MLGQLALPGERFVRPVPPVGSNVRAANDIGMDSRTLPAGAGGAQYGRTADAASRQEAALGSLRSDLCVALTGFDGKQARGARRGYSSSVEMTFDGLCSSDAAAVAAASAGPPET